MSCHGVDGKGMAAGGFPRLAGLPEAYIAKQLADFKAGRRENPLMQPIAQALGDGEAAAVAKAYASQPKVSIKAGPVERPKEGSGAWLALRGAWERNIPECTLCHGPAGVGVGDVASCSVTARRRLSSPITSICGSILMRGFRPRRGARPRLRCSR